MASPVLFPIDWMCESYPPEWILRYLQSKSYHYNEPKQVSEQNPNANGENEKIKILVTKKRISLFGISQGFSFVDRAHVWHLLSIRKPAKLSYFCFEYFLFLLSNYQFIIYPTSSKTLHYLLSFHLPSYYIPPTYYPTYPLLCVP
jgi:hypothetical protein